MRKVQGRVLLDALHDAGWMARSLPCGMYGELSALVDFPRTSQWPSTSTYHFISHAIDPKAQGED